MFLEEEQGRRPMRGVTGSGGKRDKMPSLLAHIVDGLTNILAVTRNCLIFPGPRIFASGAAGKAQHERGCQQKANYFLFHK